MELKFHPSICIFILALFIRVFFVLSFPSPLGSDSLTYHRLASNLASGEGYREQREVITSYRPPGYPLFLAAVYRLFGSNTLSPRLVQALLGAFTVLTVTILANTLYDEKTSWIAGILLSVFPVQIYYSNLLLSEVLFTALFSLFLLMTTRTPSNKNAVFLGVIHGLSVLIRPSILFYPLVLLIGKFSLKLRAKYLTILFSVSLLIIGGWVYRNFKIFNRPTFISTNVGVNFWIGHNPEANGTYRFPDDNPLWDIEDEALRSRTGLELGIDYILSHPLEDLKLAVYKIWWLFLPDLQTGTGIITRDSTTLIWLYMINALFHISVLLFSLLLLERLPDRRWLILSMIYWGVLHILFFGHPRFLYPLLPFLILPLCYRLAHGNNLRDIFSKRNKFALLWAGFILMGWIVLGMKFALSF